MSGRLLGLSVGAPSSEAESRFGASLDPSWGRVGVRRFLGGAIEVTARRGRIVAIALRLGVVPQAQCGIPSTEDELRRWLVEIGIGVSSVYSNPEGGGLVLRSVRGVSFVVDEGTFVSVQTTTCADSPDPDD